MSPITIDQLDRAVRAARCEGRVDYLDSPNAEARAVMPA